MWELSAEYTKLTEGKSPQTRCIMKCPNGHPYDIAKQTVQAYTSRKCEACNITYAYPDKLPMKKERESRDSLVEVSDCFEHSYEEIASELNISVVEAKKSCDSAMQKLLKVVEADATLSAGFREYLADS